MQIYTRKAITENWTRTGFNKDPWSSKDQRTATAISGFSKPDEIIRNSKDSTGYRSPSPYACPWTGELFIEGSIHGTGVKVTDPYWGTVMRGERGGDILYKIPLPSLPSYDSDYLRMKILGNIKDEVLDVAMVLAEMKETTNMLSNALYTVGRSLRAVKRRKPESFSYLMHGRRTDNRRPTDKFLRETAGVFLQWKYGITPTLMNIQGATKALDMNEDGSLFDNPPLLVARSQISKEIPMKIKGSAIYAGGVPHEKTFNVVLKRDQRARCDYSVDGEGIRGLNRYGLGLGTVATVLWDRKPFSFVLDMVFPVADLIKAWTALGGVNVKGYTETYHDQIIHKTGETSPISLDNYYISTLSIKPNGVLGTTWYRTTKSRPPFPAPFIRNPIKTSNISTVLALFTQLRKP